MEKLSLKELNTRFAELGGQTVEVYGWVRTIRDSKNFAFIELHDGTFFKTTQIVLDATFADYKNIIAQARDKINGWFGTVDENDIQSVLNILL